jgi:hypothetical protein
VGAGHVALWYCSWGYTARLGGPPHELLYTVALRVVRGGMAAAVRWWESPHSPRIVRLGMAVRSACFTVAVTLGQSMMWSVRLFSACRPSLVTPLQPLRLRVLSAVRLTASSEILRCASSFP